MLARGIPTRVNHDPSSERRRLLPLAAVIVLAGAWVYAPALRGEWIWDDAEEVLRNPVLRGPADALAGIWLAPAGADYFPLKTTVQWAEWHIWGDRPLGYHIASIALHLLSALLFWRLLRRLFALAGGPAGELGPWLGGLLFAIHPLAVESVAWIAELKNTLSLPPLFLAMNAYVDGFLGGPGAFPGPRRRLFALFWFAVAMLCKSSVVMLPAVLLLFGWWLRGRIGRRDLWASAPFLAVSLALGLVTIWFQEHRAIGYDLPIGGVASRVAGAGLAIAFYLGKFLWPADLILIYPQWHLTPPSSAQFLPWIAIAAAAGWLWTRERAHARPAIGGSDRPGWERTALFGLGFFAVNLAPVLGFIPMAYLRQSWVADHFAYLPMLGLIGLAAAGAGVAAEWAGSRAWVAPLALGGAGACALLAIVAHRNASVFRTAEAVWTRTLRGNPDSWTAHYDLGLVLHSAGRLPEAVDHYREAIRLNPALAGAHYNLGIALAGVGRNAEAIIQYRETLRIEPGNAEARNNLGIALGQGGRAAEAIAQFQSALQERPGFADAHYNLGTALLRAGRIAEAIAQYREAIRIEPGNADAHNNLGWALKAQGRTSEASVQLEEAARLRGAR